MLLQTNSSRSSSHVVVAAEATKVLQKAVIAGPRAAPQQAHLLDCELKIEEPAFRCINSYVNRVEYSTQKIQPRIQLAPPSLHPYTTKRDQYPVIFEFMTEFTAEIQPVYIGPQYSK
jgi:hypothetical protein